MRKPISKNLRFEVFKRDSFTCQYCGNNAPNVILEIDHINPVSKGGTNNIINLITSCFDCNRGKSDKKIEDNSLYKLQTNQMKILNEKRQQLEMMSQWQQQLLEEDDICFNMFNKHFTNITLCRVNEKSVNKNRCVQLVKKYGIIEVAECIRISFAKYGNPEFFEMIFKIIKCRELALKNPLLKDIYYIRAILRNRITIYDERKVFTKIKFYLENNGSFEYIKDLACTCRNWSDFMKGIE